jgi:uncharacterized membrane protein
LNTMRAPCALIMTAMLFAVVPLVSASDYTPKTIEYTLYSDGVAEVKYGMELDSSLVQVNVELPGPPYDSLVVINQDGLPLEAAVNPTGVTIDSIGSNYADVLYYTLALTSKTGSVWTFNVSTPIAARVMLPQSAAIISLSELPIEIGVEQGRPHVLMPPGLVSISYLAGALDAVAKASDALDEAEAYLSEIEETGVELTEARILLAEAYARFNAADYAGAITRSGEAVDAADETRQEASEASALIDMADAAVSQALSEGRTDGIDAAVTYLSQATSVYEAGGYSMAKDYAKLSKAAAEHATQPFDAGLTVLAAVGLVVIASGLYMMSRRGAMKAAPQREHFIIDLDAVFRDNPGLRFEDREALKFISEAGGEVFANEIKEKFELPRTSAWRMIRRLVGLEIIEERKVGGQSLVSVSRRYRR